MEQHELEIQLWEYIDGTSSPAEREHIDMLLATDGQVKRQYEEMLAFQSVLQTAAPEEPSLRFTKNVMEALAQTTIAPAANKYVNPFVLRGIAAFFIVSMLVIIAYALANVRTTQATALSLPQINLQALHPERVLSPVFISMFFGVNVIVGLVLADMYLRRRGRRHT